MKDDIDNILAVAENNGEIIPGKAEAIKENGDKVVAENEKENFKAKENNEEKKTSDRPLEN